MAALWNHQPLSTYTHGCERPSSHLADLMALSLLYLTQSDLDKWQSFVPPPLIPVNHPYLTRFSSTSLVFFDNGPADANLIRAFDFRVYGPPGTPILFRVGGGCVGMCGLLQVLAETYIALHGGEFRIGWVINRPRYSTVNLLADVVQVVLTIETQFQRLALGEGWCEDIGPIAHDHMILLGHKQHSQYFPPDCSLPRALHALAAQRRGQSNPNLFYSAGDGSDSFWKKQQLWQTAGVDLSNITWDKTDPATPGVGLPGICRTTVDCSFKFSHRSTTLAERKEGLARGMRMIAEGGEELLEPVSALVNCTPEIQRKESTIAGRRFAEWLLGEEAQTIIHHHGRQWADNLPCYTPAIIKDFAAGDRLSRIKSG